MRSGRRADGPHATVLGSFIEGWRRTLGAPATIAGVALLTLAAGLPLAVAVYAARISALGPSVLPDRLIPGSTPDWAAGFGAHGRGVATAFTDEIVGFGGTVATLIAAFEEAPPRPGVALAVVVYVVLWIFVSGGILDRYARAGPIGTAAFFSACGVYFGRFLRLAVMTGLGYWAIVAWLHPLLFGTLWTGFMYVLLAAALMSVAIVADFAKVRTVVEDRRSMVAALVSSWRFIRRRPARIVALYLLNTAAAVTLAGLWMWAGPPASWTPWVAFGVAQIYVVGRLTARLAFMASEVAFFHGELAHRYDTSVPETVWPDAPAAESIR